MECFSSKQSRDERRESHKITMSNHPKPIHRTRGLLATWRAMLFVYCRYLCMNKSERLAEEKNGVLRFMYSSLCVDVVTFCMFSKQEIHRGGCNFLTCDVTLHSLESDELVSYTHHTLHTMIHFKGQYLTSSNQLFLYAHMSRIIQAVYFIYIYFKMNAS